MNSLAKSTVNCTNGIVISDIKIHVDSDGRYSLNDLHKASGGEKRHQPSDWLRLSQTIELINEIINPGNPGIQEIVNSGISLFHPIKVRRGCKGGTYVCKELVYSYAMWISAAFALKVIRAYDALVSGETEKAEAIAKTTVDQRTPLRDAVNMLVSKKHLMYPEAYSIIHQRFAVSSIEDLTSEQVGQAIEYVHRIVLDGEYIPANEDGSPSERERLAYNINAAITHFRAINDEWNRSIYPSLRSVSSPIAGKLHDRFVDGHIFLRYAQDGAMGLLRDGETPRITQIPIGIN
ncbi:KilA-N domain-containing protein [Edwardsiella tarda]